VGRARYVRCAAVQRCRARPLNGGDGTEAEPADTTECDARISTVTATTAPDDEADWAAALGGDGDAFGRIFDRHRQRLFRHSYRLVAVTADADDIVSIAFLEAWRRADAVRFVDGSMLPWLLVTATNSARNLARSSRRYRTMLSRLPPDPHADDHHFDTFGTDAHDALRRLSAADQRVITLCVLEDLSEKEAARLLGVPVGTVKSRLSRAKTRLAGHLAPPPRAKEVSNEQ
jgi:RNA polymerase sigma-70 factor (ECF subfamily)